VLDAGDVGRALGDEVRDQSSAFHASVFEGVAFGSDGCTYTTDDGVEVAVLVVGDEQGRSGAVVEQLRAAAATSEEQHGGPDATALDDLGDDAFYDPLSGAVVVRVDDTTLTVFLGDPFDDRRAPDPDDLVALARRAVPIAREAVEDERWCAAVEPLAAELLGDIRGRGVGSIPGTRDGVAYEMFECSFEGADGTRVDVGRGAAEVFAVLDQREVPAGDRPFDPVPGVGDVAFWWRSGLWVVDGETGLLIEGADGAHPASDAQVLDVARLAVQEIGG
jgi:hypothetical protein